MLVTLGLLFEVNVSADPEQSNFAPIPYPEHQEIRDDSPAHEQSHNMGTVKLDTSTDLPVEPCLLCNVPVNRRVGVAGYKAEGGLCVWC